MSTNWNFLEYEHKKTQASIMYMKEIFTPIYMQISFFSCFFIFQRHKTNILFFRLFRLIFFFFSIFFSFFPFFIYLHLKLIARLIQRCFKQCKITSVGRLYGRVLAQPTIKNRTRVNHMELEGSSTKPWILHLDGANNVKGSGVGNMLTHPGGTLVERQYD